MELGLRGDSMSAGRIQFAEFEIDQVGYQLRRKGRVVPIEHKPLDLLLFLVERRGQLVTREEIRSRLWGADVFLDIESSINTAIRKLRRVLRERPRAPRFIETVPGKGYRFLAVIPEPAPPAIPIRESEIAMADSESNTIPLTRGQASERRHLTILICELMKAIGPTIQPDPEEWWENIADYHHAVIHEIDTYGGHVSPFRGDAVMAHFGWPAARDNDAENAVRAGLAIIDVIARLNEQSSYPKICGRVGIDSGMVVIGAGAGKDADVFGDVPKIAARVQAAAEPNSVVITGAVHQLISGFFVVEKAGTQQLAGAAAPIELLRVLRPTGAKGRIAAAPTVARS